MKSNLQVAIIQLTRTGDLLQAYQVVKQAKKEYPDATFTLIARDKFVKGIRFLTDEVFDKTFTIDTKSFFTKPSFATAQSNLQHLITEINHVKYDMVVNLSFNKSSSYLSTLINAKVRLGIYRNLDGEVAIDDKWGQYVYATVMSGTQNPFNLVEIYRNMLGVKRFEPQGNKDCYNDLIVIHPFASQIKKRWGSSKWVEVIYRLAKENPTHKIAIVGGPSDIKEQNQIVNSPMLMDLHSQIEACAGELDIQGTYALLNQARVFIGHDSMVSHLAAITNTPAVILSLGTVRPSETTPYFDKALNIVPKTKCFPCQVNTTCELMPCHNDINYQTVLAVANLIIREEVISRDTLYNEVSTFHLNSCKIYWSMLNEEGYFKLFNLTDDFESSQEVCHTVYRYIWNLYLKYQEDNISAPLISEQTAEKLAQELEGVQYLYEIYNFASKFAKELVEESKKKNPKTNTINELVAKLTEIDRLTNITKTTYPITKPIIEFFYVSKCNVPGNNLKELSENYLLFYYDASNLCAMLFELVEQTIAPLLDKKDSEKNSNINITDV